MADNVLEIPVCMLEVVACAAKEPGKYALDAVLVETKDAGVVAVASDGRRMMLAEFGKGLFSGSVSVIIPAYIAKMATKLAKVGKNERPMASIAVAEEAGVLTIDTPTGVARFDWTINADGLKFPDYRGIIPKFAEYNGVGVLGLGPTLVADTLKAIVKVIGFEAPICAYIPKTAERPIGLEVNYDGLRVLGLVMPMTVPDWVDKPEVTEAEDEDDVQPALVGNDE